MSASSNASGGYTYSSGQGGSQGSSQGTSNVQVVQTPQSEYSLWLAQMGAAYGDSMFKWAGNNYGAISGLANQGIDSYLNAAGNMQNLTGQLANQYTSTYLPENQQLANEASTYSSPSRVATNMGAAEAGAAQGAYQNWNNTKQTLQSYGVNPSSGMYGELQSAANTAAGASEAGAGNQARQNTEATGRSLLQASTSLGATEPANINATTNTQYGGLSGAVNTGQSNVNTGANLYNTANNFYTTAGQSLKLPTSGQQSQQASQQSSQQSNTSVSKNASVGGSSTYGGGGGGGGGGSSYARGGAVHRGQGGRASIQPPRGGLPDRPGFMLGGGAPLGPGAINGPKGPQLGNTPSDQAVKAMMNSNQGPTTETGMPLGGKNWFYGYGYANAKPGDPSQMAAHQGGQIPDGKDAPNTHAPAGAGLAKGGVPDQTSDAYAGGGPATPQAPTAPPTGNAPATSTQNTGSAASNAQMAAAAGAPGTVSNAALVRGDINPSAPGIQPPQWGVAQGGGIPAPKFGAFQSNAKSIHENNVPQRTGAPAQAATGGQIDHTMPQGHAGRPMPLHPYLKNGLPDASTGGHIPYELSPSHGHTTDDVVANLNAGEFVIPRRTVHHLGNKFLYDLIAKSDKEMGMHPQPVGPEPLKKGSGADKARDTAESQNFMSGGGI